MISMISMIDNDLPANSSHSIRVGGTDGVLYSSIRNVTVAPSPPAAAAYVRAALARNEVVGAASGLFDGQLYIWFYLEDIDATATRALFDLQAAIEQRFQGTFEVHVSAPGPFDRRDVATGLSVARISVMSVAIQEESSEAGD